jgi:NAD(P)-dependent dehydrogenase (short-subunit alcohol dehydrogenase family)
MSELEAQGQAPARHRLTDRRVLVVGAGTRATAEPDAPPGNGRAIAVLAAREGAAVACADVDGEAAAATVALAEGEGTKAVAITADVADAEQCARMVERARAALGGLDGVVLNVGIGLGAGLAGTDVEDWDRALAINLRAHFLVCKAAFPLLSDGAAVVLVGSAAGLRAGSGSPSYDSSKAALLGLCRHVAREGAARAIRANTLVPGLIDTPMGRAASARNPARAQGAARVPLGRQGSPWEVAYAAVFLLSGEASYISGQALVVDGGLTA